MSYIDDNGLYHDKKVIDEEEWKVLKGFAKDYEISSKGRFKVPNLYFYLFWL